MGEKWRPNVAYGPAGTRVEYEGTTYELIQPHTSQMGWEPTQTPALWRVARDQGHHSSHHDDHHHSSHHDDHKHSSHHDDHHHSSHHDDHKHDDHKHEEKPQQPQQPQPQQPQPQQVQQQQQQVNAQVPQPQGTRYYWVPYTGQLPANAVTLSNSLGKTFAVARGSVEGGIHPGYCDPAKNRCYTSYGGKEVICEKFEVLTIEPKDKYQWVKCDKVDQVQNKIDGGREKDNTPLFCCKMVRDGVPYFGKTFPGNTFAYHGLSGKEYKVSDYEVLTFTN